MLLRRNFRLLSSLQRCGVRHTLYDDRSAERMRICETELRNCQNQVAYSSVNH
jgi:hypothetical protein